MRYLILLFSIFLIGCSTGRNSIEKYVQSLEITRKDKELISRITNKTDQEYPLGGLAKVYKLLLSKWTYVADEEGNDLIEKPYTSIVLNDFSGDCDDFSAVLFAVCNKYDLQCHFVLGKFHNSGHVWVEVLLDKRSLEGRNINSILEHFGRRVNIMKRGKKYWIQLSLNEAHKFYEPEYYVEKDLTIKRFD